MSGCKTHMLIGAVSGLGLMRLLPLVGEPRPVGMSALMWSGVFCLGSALLATWPDIDEPGSFISRRVRGVIGVIALVLGGAVGFASRQQLPIGQVPYPLVAVAIGAALGGGLGYGLLGPALLHGMKHAAGGHRRLTHSLVLDVILVGLALVLWQVQANAWVLLPVILIYSQLVHLVGDLVTVGGVPLLWPLSERDVRVLPRSVARYGEPIIAVVALAAGWLLLR